VPLQVKANGRYLLGCAIMSCNAWLLLATEIDPKPAVKLPGGHYVFNVTRHQWESIPLQVLLYTCRLCLFWYCALLAFAAVYWSTSCNQRLFERLCTIRNVCVVYTVADVNSNALQKILGLCKRYSLICLPENRLCKCSSD
jgi:hypothetical protein